MIGEDDELLWETLKIVAPIFKGSDYAHKFTIVDFVITLGLCHAFRAVGNWVPSSIFGLLLQDSTGGKAGGV